MRPPLPAVGDQYLCDVVTTSDWQTARDVTVTIDRVTRLGCGCLRLETTRPGPADGPLAGPMHLVVNRCGFHEANTPDGTSEPRRVEEATA